MTLLALKDSVSGVFSLPKLVITQAGHPHVQAATWLKGMGLANFSAASWSNLNIKGWHAETLPRWLHMGYLLWLPNPQPTGQLLQWHALDSIDRFESYDGSFICEALAQFWSKMPTANPRFNDISPFGGAPSHQDQAIFFGGSFNPWHRAHQECMALYPHPEQIILVPDTNPQKPYRQRVCAWASYRDFLARTHQFGAVVFPGFCGREFANPTVSWLPFSHYASRQMLMGEDAFVSLPAWIEATRLVTALNQIWVVPRRSKQSDIHKAQAWFLHHAPHCKLTFLGDHPFRDVSSTAMREKGPGQT